eukprot:CAMPEP_0119004284 /NCGR_PEP_ID=MMETSP1176-20130426/1055_1 /TAXON_ID=265551 /ORGANISM="Synedropsis recta cf, Strain CCMP1620" /LENGTH=257 /DNA_ID=CAMNT_0006955971 /DNA_START=55 /DNA_END=825 /DNA_ORIENTATION=+
MSHFKHAQVPMATTPRGAWIVELIRKSPIPVPKLRKDAHRESCRVVHSEDALKDIFLDAMCGSPYFSESQKQKLANAVLRGAWLKLLPLLGVTDAHGEPLFFDSVSPQEEGRDRMSTTSLLMSEFKYMAVQIFLKSRKIRLLTRKRKQKLGAALLRCTTREGLVEFLLQSLHESQVLCIATRKRIANDVLDGNFHRLLLEDRFDCDEEPRLDLQAGFMKENEDEDEDEECIICFFPFNERTLANCEHTFCQDCIEDW